MSENENNPIFEADENLPETGVPPAEVDNVDKDVSFVPSQDQIEETTVCRNCGAQLSEEQIFCTKCGTPVESTPKKKICSNCGAEFDDDRAFCTSCGTPLKPFDDPQIPMPPTTKPKKKGKLIAIIVAAVAVVVIAVTAILVLPGLLVSVEDLCAKGEYQKAYDKAKDDEKEMIFFENLAAVEYGKVYDRFTSATSYEYSLKGVYYDTENFDDKDVDFLVTHLSVKSDDETISLYLLYYEDDEGDWDAFSNMIFDLEEDKYASTEEEKDDNTVRYEMRKIISGGTQLSSDRVSRINTLVEVGNIEDVILLDRESAE